MRRVRFDAALIAVAVLALPLASCVDGPSPTQPLDGDAASAPDVLIPSAAVRGFGNTLDWRTSSLVVLGRSSPLATPVTRTQVIGPTGGILHLPEAGMRLVIPERALARPTTISATALAGRLVAYDLEPHGLQFARNVRIVQDLSVTVYAAESEVSSPEAMGGGLVGGYYEGQLGPVTQSVETFPVRVVSVGDGGAGESLLAMFETPHFSGYIIGTN